jgi:hypothetical protein
MTTRASQTFVLLELDGSGPDGGPGARNGVEVASLKRMSNSTVSPEELLERATELAKSDGNLDMMDRTTMLRGYLGLRTLDPENGSYKKNVEDAVSSLLQGAHQHAHWHPLVSS